ncbi:hypothetical protein [Burkholderia ubonensis]|uniref:hypothetical protein n=1 Tax=Burkholderia ubonensis TaxID=101571 RepID=UPI000A4E6DBE|nr:hypothetical protein [Burkholderia ubonensis]
MSDKGNTVGRLYGQASMSSAPASSANPPVKAETPEEEGWFSKWWGNTKHELSEAADHPWEATKGAVKGIANIPSDIGELLIKGSTLQTAGQMEQAAAMQSVFGQTQSAEALTRGAQEVKASAGSIELPKFKMSNAAQAGGDKVATAVSIAAGGAGIVKGGIRGVAALGKAGAIEGAELSKTAAATGKVLQTEGTIAEGTKTADATANATKATSAAEGAGTGKAAGDGAKVEKVLPPLRQAYVDEVSNLKDVVNSMREAGSTPEQIARRVHQMRRDLGVKYKNLSPPDKLAEIYERNMVKYQDKLGPSIEWLRAKGKSWDQIIESATRTGGKDLGF